MTTLKSLAKHVTHEGMLGGAIDSYIATLDHVQPHRAERHEAQLTDLLDQWLATGGDNQLNALTTEWLAAYLAATPEPTKAAAILCHFFTWTVQQKLLATNPVAQVPVH